MTALREWWRRRRIAAQQRRTQAWFEQAQVCAGEQEHR